MEMMLGENSGVMILQLVVIGLAITILMMLYSDSDTIKSVKQVVDNMDCVKECPQCPDCPDLVSEGCPACICNEASATPGMMECPTCPKCPTCPSCPSQSMPKVDDIVDAIFPGRNRGLTSHGNYFPLDGLGETTVEPAYSSVANLTSDLGDTAGVVSFSDQMMDNSIALAGKKDPPISAGAGVMSMGKNINNPKATNTMDANPTTAMMDEPVTPPDSPVNSDEEGMDSEAPTPTEGKKSSEGIIGEIEGELSSLESEIENIF